MRGPDGAHTLPNDAEEPVRLLMLSSDEEAVVEVELYPDSGKRARSSSCEHQGQS